MASDGVRLWLADTPPDSASDTRLPVVFLHGFSGSSSATGHLARAVASAGHRFVAPDLRGHGLSEKPTSAQAYTLERFVSDVSDVSNQLHLPRFHLAGHCMGGMVATAFALARPDRIASLSLIGTSLRPSMEHPLFTRISAAADRPIALLAKRAFPTGRRAEPHADYSRFRVMGDIYWRRLIADWCALTWETGEVVTRTIRSLDLLEAASAIRTPTLVAHGARDSIFPPAAADRTHASITASRLLVLPKDNHVTLVLDPESALFGEIVSFAQESETYV